MLSAESVPGLPTGGEILPWQDDAWTLRLRRELSFSHLLELSRVSDPLARAFYEVRPIEITSAEEGTDAGDR
jgi:hypothetical protein